MTRNNSGWSSRVWQYSAVDDGEVARPMEQASVSEKWKEVSNTVGELGTLVKDKKGTWITGCKESMKRETEVHVMADELTTTGKANGKPGQQ